MNLSLTFFPSLTDPAGKRVSTTWPKLLARLSEPRVEPDKYAVPGLSFATFAGDRRALANVERVHVVGLDLDEKVSLGVLRKLFDNVAAFVHTTHSSTIDEPRCRVFLLLSRPVSSEEYRRVYRAVAGKVEEGGLVVDRQASDPSRFWFLPSVAEVGRSFIYWTCDGPAVNVDWALATVPEQAPPAPVTPRPLASGGASTFDRARKYLAKIAGAVSGSGGSAHTFVVACKLVRGFALPIEDALSLMLEWNQTCSPPWSERELRRKLEQAATQGRGPEGDLADRVRP